MPDQASERRLDTSTQQTSNFRLLLYLAVCTCACVLLFLKLLCFSMLTVAVSVCMAGCLCPCRMPSPLFIPYSCTCTLHVLQWCVPFQSQHTAASISHIPMLTTTISIIPAAFIKTTYQRKGLLTYYQLFNN